VDLYLHFPDSRRGQAKPSFSLLQQKVFIDIIKVQNSFKRKVQEAEYCNYKDPRTHPLPLKTKKL
jgi:hypothetical protein